MAEAGALSHSQPSTLPSTQGLKGLKYFSTFMVSSETKHGASAGSARERPVAGQGSGFQRFGICGGFRVKGLC